MFRDASNTGKKFHCACRDSMTCKTNKTCIFNTALVLNPLGQIQTHYHKFNVYETTHIDTPAKLKPTFFTINQVKIGLMICFDINYAHPGLDLVQDEGIELVILQAAWTDELPFLTAPQYHFGWAVANNITLAVSGYHDPEKGSLGTVEFFSKYICCISKHLKLNASLVKLPKLWWILNVFT